MGLRERVIEDLSHNRVGSGIYEWYVSKGGVATIELLEFYVASSGNSLLFLSMPLMLIELEINVLTEDNRVVMFL